MKGRIGLWRKWGRQFRAPDLLLPEEGVGGTVAFSEMVHSLL